jgi:flagellar biosynthesis protein FliQ
VQIDAGGGRAPRRRWGVVTAAVWYAGALLVPVVLGAVVLGRHFLGLGRPDPDPVRPCDRPMACGSFEPDVWQVLRVIVPFLLVSLVVAVPLQRLFARRAWPPVLAGTLAPVLAWLACLLAACGLLLGVRLVRG